MSLDATEPDVSEVVAQVAKVQPLWALLRLEDRARYMRRMAQAIVDELDELRETIAAEQRRPLGELRLPGAAPNASPLRTENPIPSKTCCMRCKRCDQAISRSA